MSHLAPPERSYDVKRRRSNASQAVGQENIQEYKTDNANSSQDSSISRRRSETERPLPRQVSAAFDDKSSSYNDSMNLKINRNSIN